MEAVISRLEAVATRLESVEVRSRSGTSGAGSSVPSQAADTVVADAAAVAAGGAGAVADWDTEVMPALSNLAATGESIGGDVQKASDVVSKAFQEERKVVEAIAQCQKPDQVGLQNLVTPVGMQLQAASALTEGRRTTAFNHFKVVAEALQALTWVVYTGPSCGMSLPAQHIDDAWQSAEFFANKVLMEFRNTDAAHVAWIKGLKELLLKLKTFVQKHYRTGPAWNAAGVPVSSFKPSGASKPAPAARAAAPAAAPRKAGGHPPAPPPPAPGSLFKEKSPSSGAAADSAAGLGAVFSQINSKGDGVTSGLRKVTADMKSKNRTDRSGVVSAATPATTASASTAKPKASSGPPRVECEQGRKWVVENQNGNREVILDDTNPKQTVYIYKCRNSTIQVKGKLNAITIDQCTRTGVVFEDLVSACELVNSSNLQVQVTGIVPTVAIDKCDGVQLFLSGASLGASITTAKCSEVNVLVPGAEGEDMKELYIPEQFISTFKDGHFVTEPVSHSG